MLFKIGIVWVTLLIALAMRGIWLRVYSMRANMQQTSEITTNSYSSIELFITYATRKPINLVIKIQTFYFFFVCFHLFHRFTKANI